MKLGEFHDTYRDNVERPIEEKKKGKKITTVKQPPKAPVIDLVEALKSLDLQPHSENSEQPARTRPTAKKAAQNAKRRNNGSAFHRTA